MTTGATILGWKTTSLALWILNQFPLSDGRIRKFTHPVHRTKNALATFVIHRLLGVETLLDVSVQTSSVGEGMVTVGAEQNGLIVTP
jgi:hypothetical protein